MLRAVVLGLCLVLPLIAADAPPPLVVPRQPAVVDALPVLHGGRVKPFAVAASESLLAITTKADFGEVVEVGDQQRDLAKRHRTTDLVMAMLLAPQVWADRPLVAVPWLPLQQRLGITGQWATMNELKPHQGFFAELDAKQMRRQNEELPWSEDEQKAYEVADRWARALDLLAGRSIAFAPLAADRAERDGVLAILGPVIRDELTRDRAWRQLLKRSVNQGGNAADHLRQQDPWLTFEDLVRDPDPLLARDGLPPRLKAVVGASREIGKSLALGGEGPTYTIPAFVDAIRAAGQARAVDRLGDATGAGNATIYPSPALVDAELLYYRARPFTWAWMAFILGGLLTAWGLSQQQRLARTKATPLALAGMALTVIGCLCTVAGLAARTWITGLGAVTNLYETLIYVALLVALLGLFFARFTGRGIYAVCGGVGAGLCAMVGEAMPPELGSQISQLQPVLRSRFWLWLHVKVVVAAYAPYVLALILGNVVLWKAWQERRPVSQDESRLLYRCLQWGTVLMVAGTLLGGVWADAAWGRFWGWDPKEVGALTIILTFLIPLHLRYVGVVGPTGIAAWSVLGFLSVVWSWYGVNFILGAGMHAYAFGNGGQWIVLPLAGAQCLLTTWQLLAIRWHGRRPVLPG